MDTVVKYMLKHKRTDRLISNEAKHHLKLHKALPKKKCGMGATTPIFSPGSHTPK